MLLQTVYRNPVHPILIQHQLSHECICNVHKKGRIIWCLADVYWRSIALSIPPPPPHCHARELTWQMQDWQARIKGMRRLLQSLLVKKSPFWCLHGNVSVIQCALRHCVALYMWSCVHGIISCKLHRLCECLHERLRVPAHIDSKAIVAYCR